MSKRWPSGTANRVIWMNFVRGRVLSMVRRSRRLRALLLPERRAGELQHRLGQQNSAGKLVRPGKYTVYLEVVREHGTYQLMKKEMNFDGTPSQVQFPANTEVAASSFDYHKISGR